MARYLRLNFVTIQIIVLEPCAISTCMKTLFAGTEVGSMGKKIALIFSLLVLATLLAPIAALPCFASGDTHASPEAAGFPRTFRITTMPGRASWRVWPAGSKPTRSISSAR